MFTTMKVIGIAWLLWFALNLYIVAFARKGALTDGLTAYATGLFGRGAIVISPKARLILDAEELKAIIAHEQGHIANSHILENFLVAVFLPFLLLWRADRREEQELEADDFAVAQLGWAPLASALRKLSTHRFDIQRAERLEAYGERGSRLGLTVAAQG